MINLRPTYSQVLNVVSNTSEEVGEQKLSQNRLDMGRVVPTSRLLSGSTQLLLTVLMLATVARVANGCSISGLQVGKTSNTSITITWTNNSYVNSYTFELYDNVQNASSNFSTDGSAYNFTFTELVPGRSYRIRVTLGCVGFSNYYGEVNAQINMAIRLAGNTTTCQGRVEVFYNGEWGTVCDDFWSAQDAKVVCRQLGCGLTGFAVSLAYFGLGSGLIWLDDVQCSGYETQLSDCSHLLWGTHNCGHGEDASVICLQVPNLIVLTITSKTTTTMTVSGTTSLPELFSYSIYLRETASGNLVTTFWIYSNVTTFTGLVPGRNYSVSVEASNSTFKYESDVVTDRTLPPKVNVTVIVNRPTAMTVSWVAPISDVDYYIVYLNETNNASVAHHFNFSSSVTMQRLIGLVPGRSYQISVTANSGINSQSSAIITKRSFPPQVTVTVIVNNLTAMTVSWVAPISDVDYYVVYLSETYNATAVMSFNLYSNITTRAFTNLVPGRSYNASVTAYSGNNSQPSDIVTSITNMSIRLAGNTTTCQGRVEVFYNGEWGTVCDDFWSTQNAKVVCRQLGCGLTVFAVSNAYFGLGIGPILLDDVQCSGYETQLSDCRHRPWGNNDCSHYEDASVICLQVPSYIVLTITNKTSTTMTVSGTTTLPESFSYWAYLRETASGSLVTTFQINSTTETFPGLVPGRNYSVSVQASNWFLSTLSDMVMDRTLPPQVNVTVTINNSTDMTVSWVAPISDVDYYIVYVNETNNSSVAYPYNVSSNVTTRRFIGLVPGRSYQISVTAYSGVNSQPSSIVTQRSFPPQVNVTVTVTSPTAMMVSWVAPTSDVDYYVVYLNETYNPTAVKLFNVSTLKTKEFTDLVPGRSYDASVTAYSGIYYQPSAIITRRTFPPQVNVTVTINNSTDMTVSWVAPISDVDYYIVYVNETNNSSVAYPYNVSSNVTTRRFIGLVPGRSYQISVTAYSGVNSQPSSIVTQRSFPPQVNVTVTVTSPTAMMVSWVAPTSDVDYYVVYLNETYNPTAVKLFNVSTLKTKEFTDLVPGRSYDASVTAYSGIYYQPSAIITRRTFPPQVNVTVTINNSTDMTVSWVAPISDVDYYIVYLNETNNSSIAYPYNVSSNVTTRRFIGLFPGRSYQISVTAYSGVNSQPSSIVTQRSFPPQVNVTVTVTSPTAMMVSWVAPTSDVDYYVVYLNETYNPTAVKLFNVSTLKTKEFTDLVPGRSYDASVTAYSGIYYQPSAIITRRTFPPQVNVTVTINNSTDMTVSWVAPISDVDYYIVYLNETNNSSVAYPYNVSSNVTTRRFIGLVPGRSYQISVTAYSGVNSQPSSIVTQRSFPPQVNVTVTVTSPTAMMVSWVAPTSDVDYYVVFLNETYNPTAVKLFNVSTLKTKEFTDLVPDRSYDASVTAYSGIYYQPSAIITRRTFPPQVNVTVTINNSTDMTVSWVAPLSDVDYYIVYLNETNNSSPYSMMVSWVAPTSDVDYYVVYLNETYNPTAVKLFNVSTLKQKNLLIWFLVEVMMLL
ncbi:receptor-type tyrosine-protein phosphatase beta-like [Lethenteron reissneri]|uniref:receptor-type tyrosine-protein phosphatase beta-like n=1 Tax=Lethenteron reissneri TaxID=7753 RepID=UPI002AB782FC|nr:receptor-type tyrosine-protein phosphatase beta-like [Lethenteron reissneri]